MLFAIPEEWTLFYELLTHTGLRISEAGGLTWSTSTWREC
jgi:integrase